MRLRQCNATPSNTNSRLAISATDAVTSHDPVTA